MQYDYDTLRTVIGDVIRNTRISDSAYIADIGEWLYQAMDMLQTKHSLKPMKATLDMKFHKAKLPCGLKYIDGVGCGGHRLPMSESARGVDGYKPYNDAGEWITQVGKVETVNGHTMYISDIQKINCAPLHSGSYFTEMGILNTSFPSGKVDVYYRGIATDTDGFPMIPNNANYKQSLYWYCRDMMIGAGWEDPVFTSNQCFEKHEYYAGRAIAEIRQTSPEEMERRVDNFVRFVPDQNYFNNWFEDSGREPMYDVNPRF